MPFITAIPPVLFVVLAIVLWSGQNIIIEAQFAKKVSTLPLMTILAGVYFTLCAITWIISEQFKIQFMYPSKEQIKLISVCAVIAFVAEFCYLFAYNRNASAITITTVMIMLPVTVSLLTLIIIKKTPTFPQMCAWIFASLAVVILSLFTSKQS